MVAWQLDELDVYADTLLSQRADLFEVLHLNSS